MDQVSGAARSIAEALAPAPSAPSARWRWGTVAAVASDGTMTVNVGGTPLVGVRAAQHCMGAKVGDRVRVAYLGTDAIVDAVRATAKLMSLPKVDGNLEVSGNLSSANITSSGYIQAGSSLKANSGAVTLRDTRLDRDGTAPSSSQYSYVLGVTDKDSELVAYLQGIQYSTGATGAAVYAVNEKSDGTQVHNVIAIQVAKDGTASYSMTSPAAFRAALGTYGRTSVGTLDWGTNNGYLVDKTALAYWNGAYSGTVSNLAYCNKGAFGTMATKSSVAASDISSGILGIARGGTGSSQVVEILNNSYWKIYAWGPMVMVQCTGATATPSNSTIMLNGTLASYKPTANVSTIVSDASGNARFARMWVEASTGNVRLAMTGYTASSSWYGTLVYMRK